jgi:drug/metabolite transporter (DMT)-like permease
MVWGVTFSVVDSAVPGTAGGAMPPADLVAWRFGLGACALLILRRRRLPSALRRRGVVLGAALGSGFLLQTWAMTYTDATMSAFLTGMLVVIAPAAGWLLFRDRPLPMTWPAVAVAAVGLATLSLRGAGFGAGELLTLAAAGCWAVHLVLLARWAEPQFAIELAGVQTGTVCVLALVVVAIGGVVGGSSPIPELPADGATWLSVLFLALLATAGAMVLLSWGQARMSATRAAVILTLEPAIAAVTAAALGGEFGPRTVVGGLLLLGAMFLVELGGRRSRRTELSVSRSGPEC